MKKIAKIVIIIAMVFTMTGCVKYNANMDIKRDKTMEFSIIYALDTAYFDDKSVLTDDELKQLEENGFEIEGYSNNDYKGAKITKKFENIDSLSTTDDVQYNISAIASPKDDTEEKKEYLFKIEKGLFKNKYIAKFVFDPSDSSLKDSEVPIENYESSDELQYDIEDNTSQSTTEEETDGDSMNSAGTFSAMDLIFNVNLPYSSLKNNATTTTNRDKTLRWVLSSEEVSTIEFEFEIYNKISMYVLIGISSITILSIILLIIAIIVKKKKEKQATLMQSYMIDPNSQQTMYMQQPGVVQYDPTTGQTYTVQSPMIMPTYDVQPTDIVQYDPVTGTTYIIQATEESNDQNNQQ